MDCEAFLSLLQFSDGLFPVGSYAHSFGLESYTAAKITIRSIDKSRLTYPIQTS